MGHPQVENGTPFLFEPLHLLDERARPVLTVVVKGTFLIDADGRCVRAEEQVPVNLGGEPWGEDLEVSSYRYEPEVAFTKLNTDVVVNGHAWAARAGVSETSVGLRVGALQKQAVVVGDRVWFKSMGQVSASKPRPFEKIPLRWERAFGGWDRSHADPNRHACEVRNPVGVGMRPTKSFEDGLRLPNVEDLEKPLRRFGDVVPPVGFGFVSPHWQPRAALAGTYDERWQKERAPLLPKNFDRAHLNAAAPGLTARGYLRGDELVVTVGMSPQGNLRCTLPGVPPPWVRLLPVRGREQVVATNLDTIIIEPDERRVLLLWRACLPLLTGPHDVKTLQITNEQPRPRPAVPGADLSR
jgi:hypothetical protein